MKKDMKKLIIQLSNERLITPSGLSLVGAILGKSDLVNNANRRSSFDKISPVKKNWRYFAFLHWITVSRKD
jgi:hypothetical protein